MSSLTSLVEISLIFSFIVGFLIAEAINIIPALYAKNKGVKNWGLAFLPAIGIGYIHGALSDQYINKKYKVLLPVINTISYIIYVPTFINYLRVYMDFLEQTLTYGEPTEAMIAEFMKALLLVYVCMIPTIISAVFTYIACYRMFAFANKEKAVMWLLLTIFLGIPLYIFMLVYMNKPGCPKDYYGQTYYEN